MFNGKIEKSEVPNELRHENERSQKRLIVIVVKPTFEFEILREKRQSEN